MNPQKLQKIKGLIKAQRPVPAKPGNPSKVYPEPGRQFPRPYPGPPPPSQTRPSVPGRPPGQRPRPQNPGPMKPRPVPGVPGAFYR